MDNMGVINAECELIKTGLFGAAPVFGVDTDWKAVFAEMRAQTVLGLPYGWLSENEIADSELRERWLGEALRQQVIGGHLVKVQEALFQLFNDNGINAVVIKGTAASVNYPVPEYRMKGDIDLLVHEDEHALAAKLLVENGYTKLSHETEYHMNFVKDHVDIELHRSIPACRICNDSDFLMSMLADGIEHGVWAEENGCRFRMLPAPENGIVLLLHMMQHIKSGLGLRQVVDWMMYVDKNLDDKTWDEDFRPAAGRLGAARFACIITRMCQMYLGLDPDISWCKDADEEACSELFKYICGQGNFGRKRADSDRVVRFLSAARSPAAVFQRLQEGGIARWGFAREHEWARPAAWIYQSVRIAGIMVAERRLPRLRDDVRESGARSRLFREIGITGEKDIRGYRHSSIENELRTNGGLWFCFSGQSMLPMLVAGRDLVHIVPASGRLKKYDIPVYRRSGGVYVMHRIINARDGSYDIRGDNTYRLEKGIKDEEIIGVVDAFTHNGKTVKVDDRRYQAYVRAHCLMYPVRWALFMGRRAAGKLRRSIGKLHN